MKQRKLFTVLLVLVLVVAMGTSVLAASFTDVGNHWAKSYIDWAAEKKLVEGYGDNTFQPNGTITKAEFYKMVNRFANYTAKKDVRYTDVKSNDWFHDEVAFGIAAGYLSDGNGSLSPNQAITRDEACRIVAYVYDLTGNSSSVNRFKDSNSITNKGAVGVLVDKRVINGYPEDNTFKPNGTLTRGEFAKILRTAVDNIGYPKAKTLGDYVVTFDATSGSFANNEKTKKVDVLKDNKVSQPVNPTYSGYDFEGWYTTSSSTGGTKFDFNTKITNNMTLYARWKETGGYTVTVNGGTANKKSYNSGEKVNISATVPEGKEFDYWSTDSSGVSFNNRNSKNTYFYMPANPVKVTANFKSTTFDLEVVKANAIEEINTEAATRKDAINGVEGATEDDKTAQVAKVDAAATTAISAINAATTTGDVDTAKTNGIAAINAVSLPTEPEEPGKPTDPTNPPEEQENPDESESQGGADNSAAGETN